jgi:hypothetical protein
VANGKDELVKYAPPVQEQPEPETKEVILQRKLKSLVESHRLMMFIKGTPLEPKCGFSRTLLEIVNGTG